MPVRSIAEFLKPYEERRTVCPPSGSAPARPTPFCRMKSSSGGILCGPLALPTFWIQQHERTQAMRSMILGLVVTVAGLSTVPEARAQYRSSPPYYSSYYGAPIYYSQAYYYSPGYAYYYTPGSASYYYSPSYGSYYSYPTWYSYPSYYYSPMYRSYYWYPGFRAWLAGY